MNEYILVYLSNFIFSKNKWGKVIKLICMNFREKMVNEKVNEWKY